MAGALLALAGVTALTVRLTGAAPARDWLGLTFPGVEPRMGVMLSILTNNVRMLGAVLLACVVAQVASGAPRDRGLERLTGSVATVGCDVALLVVAAAHALLVGAGVGAYGGRMVIGLLPHGPVELATFSLALGFYCAARRGPIARARWVAVGTMCVLGLTAGAALETFGPPRSP